MNNHKRAFLPALSRASRSGLNVMAAMARRLWITALVGLGCVAHAQIEQIQPDAATIAYFSSKPFTDLTLMYGIILDKHVLDMEVCPGSYGFEPRSLAILQKLQFAEGNKHPIAGIWSYRFDFKRCGAEKTYNILWQARPDDAPKPAFLAPGTSRADPLLAASMKVATAAAGVLQGAPKDCKQVRVTDTRVTREPASLLVDGVKRRGVWEEEWTARMCGVTFTTPICLIPSAGGGTDWQTNRCPG